MIELREAKIKDRRKVYKWLYYSDFSPFLYKLEGYTSDTLPSYDEFKKDYEDYYFDGSQPEKGRCFIILNKNQGEVEEIGVVSYTSEHLQDKITEFDIWLKGLSYTGHGYGTTAILILAGIIKEKGYAKVIIRPSKYNKMAIKSYKKAGFVEKRFKPIDYIKKDHIKVSAVGDYGPGGDVFMELQL